MIDIPITDQYIRSAVDLYKKREKDLPKSKDDMVELALSDMSIADIILHDTPSKGDAHIESWALFYWILNNWEWIQQYITMTKQISKLTNITTIFINFPTTFNMQPTIVTSMSGGIRKVLYDKCIEKLIDEE